MMLHSSCIVLVTIFVLLPGLKGQCVDCSFLFGGKCLTNETGYYCERGAILRENILSKEDYATSTADPNDLYAKCVPYPYHLLSLNKYCCFWSQSIGCSLTLHPLSHQFGNPERHCKKCRIRCKCNRHSASFKTVTWLTLCWSLSILVLFL